MSLSIAKSVTKYNQMKPNFLKVTPLEKDNEVIVHCTSVKLIHSNLSFQFKKLRLDRLNSRHKAIFLKYLNVKDWGKLGTI